MSLETLTHLNTQTLIGHTSARGHAWHYRAELQGAEPNHYPGAIPVDDVARRLFPWNPELRPIAVERPASLDQMTHLNASGLPVRWAEIPGRQAVVRSDSFGGDVMGLFTTSYEPHPYRTWLLDAVSQLLDDELSISSAGVLKNGAVAWVEISVADSLPTPEGVLFRPNLLATTTFDGSLATTYKRTVTDVVCDNTRAAALSEHGEAVKVRHSRHSRLRLADARDALAIVYDTADAFSAEVRELCATPVSNREFARFLDAWVPIAVKGEPLTGKALTLATRKRDEIRDLWDYDPRVAPWRGTAHGALQAVNTYEHHSRPVRGATRAERNMLRTLTDDFADLDHKAHQVLTEILAAV